MKLPSQNKSSAPLIPAGRYKVRISIAEFRESKARNRYLYLRLDIVEGAYKGRGVSSTIIFRSETTWLQKKGTKSWLQLLNALGWKSCASEDLLCGQQIDVFLTNKERNGSPFTEVKEYCLPLTATEVVEKAKEEGNKGSADSW